MPIPSCSNVGRDMSMALRWMILGGFFLLLTGCMTKHPMTAVEFREAVPGSFSARHETYEVQRPLAAVAETFRKNGKKCLDKTIESVSSGYMNYQRIVTDYNPTVVIGKDRAELHLQQFHETGVMYVTEVPKGGYYMLVVDATPVDKNTTRIDMYRPAFGFGNLIEAVRGWTDGSNSGCPDLTDP